MIYTIYDTIYSPIADLPPYHFNRYRFLTLHIQFACRNSMEKIEYTTEYYSLIIKRHIFEQTIFTLYNSQKVFFSIYQRMRIRNFTKMGEGLQWKGEICNVANLPPWGKVCNVADLPGGRSAMLQTFRGKVCNTTPGSRTEMFKCS